MDSPRIVKAKAKFNRLYQKFHVKPLEPYVNSRTKIKFQCTLCGDVFTKSPAHISESLIYGCVTCTKKYCHKRYAQQLKQECKQKQLKMLEPYVNATTKIKFQCLLCGHVFSSTPSVIQNKARYGCSKCNIKIRTKARCTPLKQIIANLHKYCPNVVYISCYHGISQPANFYCEKCNHYFESKPQGITRDRSFCPYCSKKQFKTYFKFRAMTTAEYRLKLKQALPNIELISKYVNSSTAVTLKCTKCHTIWQSMPISLLKQKIGCPHCSYKYRSQQRMYTEPFVKHQLAKINPIYELVGSYRGSKTKTCFKCKLCGHTWLARPNDILTHNACCPYCSSHFSTGEQTIQYLLNKYHVSYEYPFIPGTLVDRGSLHFDFKIGSHILLEYQGKQHYQPIDYFGGKESFARQQKHDRMKRAWAKQNGYLLIEIRYDQNIKDIMLPLISLLTCDMTFGNDN